MLNNTYHSVDYGLLNYLKELYLNTSGQRALYRVGLSLAKKNEVLVSNSCLHYMLSSEHSL